MKNIDETLASLLTAVCVLSIAFGGEMYCRGATNRLGELIVATPEKAVATEGLFDEYETKFWDIRDGLPFHRVTAIYPDHQGYLWLGSRFGITRFNGESFVTFGPNNTSLRSDTVTQILRDDDEHFWVSTIQGLYRSNGREFDELELEPPFDEVAAMVKTDDGTLWLATGGGLVKYDDGRITTYESSRGVKGGLLQYLRTHNGNQLIVFGSPYTQSFDPVNERFEGLPWELNDERQLESTYSGILPEDSMGYVWYQTKNGIYRFLPGKAGETVEEESETGHTTMRLLARDKAGDTWVSHLDGRISRYRDNHEKSIDLNAPYQVTLVDILVQRGADFWLGSEEGLVLLKKRKVKNYSTSNGLPAHYVASIAQLTDHKFVVGTSRGPAIVDDSPNNSNEITVVKINVQDQTMRSVCSAPGGGFWISNEHLGPLLIDAKYNVHVSPAYPLWSRLDGGQNRRVSVMTYDTKGALWVGVTDGAIKIETSGSFVHYTRDSDPAMPGEDIRAIYEHGDGSIWMGSEGDGLIILNSDGVFAKFTTSDGLSGNEVFALTRDPDGTTVWAATDNGLTRIRNRNLVSIGSDRGIPPDTLNQILIDRNKDMWITSLGGVHRISISELNAALDDKSGLTPVSVLTVNYDDGMLNAKTNGEHQPAGIIDDEGNLWIPTIKAASAFAPRWFQEIPQPAPPLIERITLDGNTIYDNTNPTNGPDFFGKPLMLRPGDGDLLEIELAAPGISLTEKAHYQIELHHDYTFTSRDQPGPRAVYTTLQPGSYEFQARVASKKNKWSAPLLAFRFERPPYFHQTRGFYLLVGILVVGIGLLLHTQRVRVLSKLQDLERIASLTSERERIARDMHDDLGSRLTHISLIAEISERENRSLTTEQTRELNIAARQAARAVEEIVWAAKPDNDTSDNTINFLIQYAEHLLSAAEISCRNNSGENWPKAYLPPEHRHSVFLAFKEAINNIVKHSNATEVKLSISRVDEKFTIRISDNGDGFDPTEISTGNGNGLKNMVSRMADIDGSCSFRSGPNNGTVVKIAFYTSKKNESGFHRK